MLNTELMQIYVLCQYIAKHSSIVQHNIYFISNLCYVDCQKMKCVIARFINY